MMRRTLLISTGLILFGLFLTGCGAAGGDDNNETVYLRFVNGYPPSESISLYGPTGVVFEDLKFGETREEHITVSRRLGGNYQLLMDSAPEPFSFGPNFYAMYPQETATAFLIRRSGSNEMTTFFFRHTRFLQDTKCMLTLGNALSVANDGLTGDDSMKSYAFQTQWRINPTGPDRPYRPKQEESLETKCGDVPLPEESQRTEFYDGNFQQEGWYFPVESEQGDTWTFAKGTILAGQGQDVVVHRTSGEYLDCLAGGISFPSVDDTDGGGGQGGGSSSCPDIGDNPFQDGTVELDQRTVTECKQPVSKSGFSVAPGETRTFGYKTAKFGDPETCSTRIRPRTSFADVIFENQGDQGLTTQETEFGGGKELFVVAYGRPINPLFKTWIGEETVKDLPDSYPGNPPSQDYDNEDEETPSSGREELFGSGQSGENGSNGSDGSGENGSEDSGNNGNGNSGG